MEGLLVGGFSIYYLFVIILAVLWFFLPFAIFGTKDRLNQIIDESFKTNRLLEEILDEIARSDLNSVVVEEIISAPRRPNSPRLE